MSTVQKVLDEIRTWSDPAEQFRKLGIKGKPSSAFACPFAVYIHRETGVPVEVSQYDVKVLDDGDPLTLKVFWVPEVMTTFIEEFDSGEYPDLELEEVKS